MTHASVPGFSSVQLRQLDNALPDAWRQRGSQANAWRYTAAAIEECRKVRAILQTMRELIEASEF